MAKAKPSTDGNLWEVHVVRRRFKYKTDPDSTTRDGIGVDLVRNGERIEVRPQKDAYAVDPADPDAARQVERYIEHAREVARAANEGIAPNVITRQAIWTAPESEGI